MIPQRPLHPGRKWELPRWMIIYFSRLRSAPKGSIRIIRVGWIYIRLSAKPPSTTYSSMPRSLWCTALPVSDNLPSSYVYAFLVIFVLCIVQCDAHIPSHPIASHDQRVRVELLSSVTYLPSGAGKSIGFDPPNEACGRGRGNKVRVLTDIEIFVSLLSLIVSPIAEPYSIPSHPNLFYPRTFVE